MAPYVKSSKVKLGCKYINEYNINENGTILVIASIEELHIEDGVLKEDGWIKLDEIGTVTINGLDAYMKTEFIERFDYARPKLEGGLILKFKIVILVSLSMILCGNIGLINDEGVEHTVIVDGTNLRFSPDSLTINEGDSVRFLWDGELLPHNSVEENGLFDSVILKQMLIICIHLIIHNRELMIFL